jgi:Uma2 family endonuclease
LLVSPAPSGRHQRIVAHLHLALAPWVSRQHLGEVRLGPGAVRLTPETYFEPDLFVIPAVAGRRPRADAPVTRLLLAVEVLSPGSVRHDRVTKRKVFQRHGVEYWVVDGGSEAIEVWRPGEERPLVLDEQLAWAPVGAGEPLVLDVRAFFAEVADTE